MQQTKRHFSSSSILRAVEEMGLAGVWSKDLVTGSEDWSPGVCKIVGHQITNGPMSFEKFLERVHPDDRKWVSQTIGKEFHLLPSEACVRILQESGLLRWTHIRSQVLFAPTGEAVCTLVIVVDITEQKQSIESLAQFERRLEALAESFCATLVTFSPDGERVQIHNWRILGLPSGSAFASKAFMDGVIPEHKERVAKHWTASLREKKPTTIRYKRSSLLDTSIADMIYFMRPLFKADGNVREWVGLAVRIFDYEDASRSGIAIKGAHVRAARALLDWSIGELARRSGVSASTIRRIESEATFSPRSQSSLLIQKSFELAGVEFSQTASGATAVSLHDQAAR